MSSPNLLERLVTRVGNLAAWLFLVAILLSTYEVIMRYVFTAPSTWVHDTTTTLCVVAFALGGAYCMGQSEHIRITFLLDRSRGRLRHALEVLALLVGLFYLAGLGYALARLAYDAVWRFNFAGRWTPEATSGPHEWPLPSVLKASLAIGTFLFLSVVVLHLVRRLTRRGD